MWQEKEGTSESEPIFSHLLHYRALKITSRWKKKMKNLQPVGSKSDSQVQETLWFPKKEKFYLSRLLFCKATMQKLIFGGNPILFHGNSLFPLSANERSKRKSKSFLPYLWHWGFSLTIRALHTSNLGLFPLFKDLLPLIKADSTSHSIQLQFYFTH